MVPIPSLQDQELIISKLDDFAKTLERHPKWTPPKPHPSLFHVWDFVKRSHYIMTEIDHLRKGEAVKYPNQIPSLNQGADNEERARISFTDVVTRTLTINQVVQNPEMLNALGQGVIDFDDDVRAKSKAVQDAIMSLPE
ncbi:hypothetical protein GMORB2_6747 [Geosmithia morbida]|uniref:Uncharacterized protein n=1 Tax=Geosmithia morbida TaxID=1094350 RepID=A0A9P5D1W8_9HYPO|nr:uncharacterized protein GMORB2_6747 [Geosmithia morbida]KAF4123197.1 hypothetical protein GMORB2_6747 [Geosmithia morbida]